MQLKLQEEERRMMQDDIVSGGLLNDEDDEYNLQSRSHEGILLNGNLYSITDFLLRRNQSIWKHDRRKRRK